MSVSLYPGIKRLHLFYTTRYDTIRTSDVRDDLLGVKVWYSTQQGFDYTALTPIDFGVGSSITIDNLLTNTTYYVRYAFISKIDPTTFTVSNELTAKTYDELASVYGELTNSPHYLARSGGSNTPDWQYATGTFRVWNLSQEVTGNGPVYSIVANSATGGLQATINSTTGVFSATGWNGTVNSAKVTFKAVYQGKEVLRDWTVVSGIGQDAPQLRLVLGPDNFIYKDSTATLATTAQVVATAVLTNLSGTPTFTVKAYRANGTEILSPSIQFTQTGNVITITNSQFHISNDISYAVIRAQIGSVYDEDTVFRLNNGTNTITVDVSNPVVQLQASNAGTVDASEYLDSGTTIEVYEGAEKLFVDNSSPYANGSWTITNIAASGIVAEDQPVYGTYSITFPEHANMTQDTASIEYTIQYKTSTGFVGTRVVKQSFAKSKAGATGATGAPGPQGPAGSSGAPGAEGLAGIVQRIAYQLVSQTGGTPSYSATTSGGSSLPGASWQSTVPSATVGTVVWYIYGQYNPNAVTYQGIAANTTAWGAPIAASVFQDIRSDNWNGNSPPTGGTFGGNAGYYLNKAEGSIYVQQAYVKGTLIAGSIISDAATLNTSGGTSLSTINSNASTALSNANTALSNANTALTNANSALSQLSNKLEAGSTYTLTGAVTVQDSGGIRVGNPTWNATTGAVTGGTGVVFTENGITAIKAGSTTFSITSAGDATFAGSLSAATGTFSGSLTAASGTFTGSLTGATGTFAGQLTAATGTFAGSLSAATGTFAGSLSAATGTFAGSLSAATGSFTGQLSVGSNPAVSGLTMTGSGAVFNTNGTFAIGNSTTNITFNGTNITLNGEVVATGNIANLAITSGKIATGAIDSTKFTSGIEPITVVSSVPGTKSTNSIFNTTDGKLYRWNGSAYVASVPSADISGTLSDAQIAAISAAKLTGQITTTQITDNAISTAKLSAGAVTAAKIDTDAVTADKIFAGAVTAVKIAANAVTADKILAGTITGDKIFAGTITAAQIASNTITAALIAGSTITGDKIAGNTITAANIQANSITVDKITSGTTSAQNSGVFGLGDATTVLGYPAVIAAKQNGNNWGIIGITTTGNNPNAGVVGGTVNTSSGTGVLGVCGTDTGFGTLQTLGALGYADSGVQGKYLRPTGPGNNAGLPRTLFLGGTSTVGAQATYYGNSGSSVVTQVDFATSTHAIFVQTGTSRLANLVVAGNTNDASGNLLSYWIDNTAGFFTKSGSSGIALQNSNLIIQAGSVRPGSDNSVVLGASYARWSEVWAANGTIQTSDERQKDILGTTPLGLEFINGLQPVAYRYKVGGNTVVGFDEDNKPIVEPRPGVRIFHGFKSQQVKQLVDALGVEDFGGWLLEDKEDPESGQALRYTEFVAPLVRAVQELYQEVQTLKQKVAALESN